MSASQSNALLLVYHHSVHANAPTIMEHVLAFERYSRYPVIRVNTEYGFDRLLSRVRFPIIVLHYSLFGSSKYRLTEPWYEWLAANEDAYKIAFFQDEHQYCPQRFAFIDRYTVDCVYTVFDPAQWEEVYLRHTHGPELVQTLTGYVSDEASANSRRYGKPDGSRTIDVGYRARKLPFCMGRGAQEKWLIAEEFVRRCSGTDLRLDISCEERDRIYGNRWYRFVGNCRGTLGTDSGASITDLDGTIYPECERILEAQPEITFEELSERLLGRHEGNVPLRAISPRCFEAAALHCCQILFEDRYNGILQPDVHYIPLRKDFSDFDEAVRQFLDPSRRREVVSRAYRDLIESGAYSFRRFIEGFDARLQGRGVQPSPAHRSDEVAQTIRRRQRMLGGVRWTRQRLRGLVPARWRRLLRERVGRGRPDPL